MRRVKGSARGIIVIWVLYYDDIVGVFLFDVILCIYSFYDVYFVSFIAISIR